MYNPLNEELMFQDRRDRAAALRAPRREDAAARAGRRWWRRQRAAVPRAR